MEDLIYSRIVSPVESILACLLKKKKMGNFIPMGLILSRDRNVRNYSINYFYKYMYIYMCLGPKKFISSFSSLNNHKLVQIGYSDDNVQVFLKF